MFKTFLFYLLDTPTGKAYYYDSNGVLQTTSIITAGTGLDVTMQSSPGNWLDTELGFIRNTTYYGTNRSYSTGQEFVKEVAKMVRELYINGTGTEVPLTVAVFKYNSKPLSGEPTYKLYYKAPVDLPEIKDKPIYDLNVNLMEGGVTQLLKAYENTIFQIPCDGSIPENVKANLDGLLVNNTIYWDIVPNNYNNGQVMIPMVKLREDGDSFGVVSGSPTIQDLVPSNVWQTSNNYTIYFNLPTTVRIRGQITVKIKNYTSYNFATGTSKSVFIGGPSVSYSKSLVYSNPAPYPNPFISGHPIYPPPGTTYPPQIPFVGTQTFYFDVEVPLDAYEKLFFWQTTTGTAGDTEILGGNLQISFASKYVPTRPWGLSLLDLFKKLVANICTQAGINGQNFNYTAKSDLLTTQLGILATSGDAIRASGDPNYQRFFYPADINGNISYGPVIKTSLRTFFESVSAIFSAALGSEQTPGQIEQLFIEQINYVFDSSTVDMELGEVTDLEWSFNNGYAFSDLQIGYPPQTYDQNAGKYEPNTILKMKAPINSFQKEMVKVSEYRTDSYGIERLRSNIGQPTSTTRNDSDNSVFLISTDTNQFIYDYYKQYFTSPVTDPNNANNTNINLVSNRPNQPISLDRSDGEYFQPNLDQAIFIFNVPGYAAIESCNLSIVGVVNEINHVAGQPADTVTFKLWLNGVVIFTDTTTVAGINTPIAINYNFTQALSYTDCIYITASTSATGVADITTCILTIGTYVVMTGQFIPVDSGTATKLISMPLVVPTSNPYSGASVVNYNYQYYLFNSLTVNTSFGVSVSVKGYTQGTAGNILFWIYVNGLRYPVSLNLPVQSTRTLQTASLLFVSPVSFSLGDVVFVSVDVPNGMNVGITEISIQFDSVLTKAYSLLRYNYSSLSGIPNLATDPVTGLPSTTVSGAPYNIEPFTPKRMYRAWRPFIESTFMPVVGGNMKFMDLSKNKYLDTVYNGLRIIEQSNEPILVGQRMFYPIMVSFKTKVPLTFSEILTGAANGHIHCTYFGNDIYLFPMDVKQIPGLNESQVWKCLVSVATDYRIFGGNLITGLNLTDMAANSIKTVFLSPVQFVPKNAVQPEMYHTKNRNQFLFNEQVSQWVNQDGYVQLFQIGDPIPLQHTTYGLDPVSYVVYKSDGTIYVASTNLTTVSSPAVVNPYVLWQTVIDTTGWDRGDYYIEVTAGVGGIAAVIKSECLRVLTVEECDNTIALQYSNSYNTQGMVFDGNIPFVGFIRFVGGYSNKFKQKYVGKFYTDQPADITVLGAIPYEVTPLIIGQVPNYMAKKILRALLLDGATLDGEGFSINEGAEFEPIFHKGKPQQFQAVEIRPTNNADGISTIAAGIDYDGSIIATIDAESFSPNANNASGSDNTDIIEIVVTN